MVRSEGNGCGKVRGGEAAGRGGGGSKGAAEGAGGAHPGRLPVGLKREVDGGGANDRRLVLEHLILGQRQLDQVVCEPGVVRGSSKEAAVARSMEP